MRAGAPFHQLGQLPKAPCPFCEATKGDDTPQPLFGINGTAADEHDPSIPKAYFDTPPALLTKGGAETDALRVSC